MLYLQALEKDLVDLKERADAADNLQDQLDQQQRQLAVLTADKEELQKELEETKDRVAQLEFDLHGRKCCSNRSCLPSRHCCPWAHCVCLMWMLK